MFRVLLDTSVLVAAVRSRQGASFALISSLPDERFQIALTLPLYLEWQAVLTRSENRAPGVTMDQTIGFLRYLASIAHRQEVHFRWRPFLPDPDDDMVLEGAVAAGCRYIITHNVRDFRGVASFGLEALSPGDFLAWLRRRG